MTGWTIVTEAPLKGMAFAREAGRVLAWDEGNQLYLLSAQGESLSFSRVPQRIVAGAISDEGSLIALLEKVMMPDCSCSMPISTSRSSASLFRVVVPDNRSPRALCRDRQSTWGRELRQSLRSGGWPSRSTIQPVAHLCFLADRPFLVGAAAFGMLVGVEILGSLVRAGSIRKSPGRIG